MATNAAGMAQLGSYECVDARIAACKSSLDNLPLQCGLQDNSTNMLPYRYVEISVGILFREIVKNTGLANFSRF